MLDSLRLVGVESDSGSASRLAQDSRLESGVRTIESRLGGSTRY